MQEIWIVVTYNYEMEHRKTINIDSSFLAFRTNENPTQRTKLVTFEPEFLNAFKIDNRNLVEIVI